MRMKWIVSAAVVTLLLLSSAAWATGGTYQEEVDVYQYSVGGSISWTHSYDHSLDPITSATLTIVADDVDLGEHDRVYFDGHDLGLLETMDSYTNWGYHPGPGNPVQGVTVSVFALDPSWIDASMPARVEVESSWGCEVETSALTVVPEPATLGLLAIGGLAILRRRRK